MSAMRWLSTLTLLAGMTPAGMAATVLTPGTPLTLTLARNTLQYNVAVEVPAGTQQFRITATSFDTCPPRYSGEAAHPCDSDLFLRYPQGFTFGTDIGQTDPTAQAQYYSAGPDDDSITVSNYGIPPAQGGTWYLALVNADDQDFSVQLNLEAYPTEHWTTSFDIRFDAKSSYCDTAPWNDPALGQTRRDLLNTAAGLLAQQIHTAVPVKVWACWKDFGGDDGSGTVLAAAGPTFFYMDSEVLEADFLPSLDDALGARLHAPWLPAKYEWYPGPAFTRLAGTPACHTGAVPCSWPDIIVYYNSNKAAAKFYDTANSPSARAQTLSVTVHELTHGLGFLGLVETDDTQTDFGARMLDYGDVFDRNVAYTGAGIQPLLSLDDTGRARALTSGEDLRWVEAAAVNSITNPRRTLPVPDSYIRLYAPNPAQSGSTLSHLDADFYPQELMGPYLPTSHPTSLGLAEPMLRAIGWDPQTQSIRHHADPLPNNWYDRAHDGHGIDFQLVMHDVAYGDLYYVVFYTYDTDGAAEYYTALGHLLDGRFVPYRDYGHTLRRMKYVPGQNKTVIDTSVTGEIAIDFHGAADSHACNDGINRQGALSLAVMSWSIGNESATWCIEPIIAPSLHASPDFAGHWYGGEGDSGWGMELFTLNLGGTTPVALATLYYPDAKNDPRWAQAMGVLDAAEATNGLTLYAPAGYCRTCTAPAVRQQNPVGTIRFRLSDSPSGDNRVDIQIPGVFTRTDAPIRKLYFAPGG